MTAETELYRKHRPRRLEDMTGQDQAVKILTGKARDMPHVILFAGPTGTGKTTAARIVASWLSKQTPTEINCGHVRGIDTVREVKELTVYRHMDGSPRVWIFDEVVQLPKATQQAFLSEMENLPPHVYWFFCTSETGGLLPTFLGRCFPVQLKALGTQDIQSILRDVLKKENRKVSVQVLDTIANGANGNARMALQVLEAALAVGDDPEAQLRAVESVSVEVVEKARFLGLALIRTASWGEIIRIIADVEDKDLETLRRQVLGYMAVVMLVGDSNPARKRLANVCITAFRDPWFQCGKAGLVQACWESCTETMQRKPIN